MLELGEAARRGKLAAGCMLLRAEARPLREQKYPHGGRIVQQLIQLPGQIILILSKEVNKLKR